MHPRQELPPALRRLAAERAGVLTRAEILAHGVSEHSIKRMARDWLTLARGMYAVGQCTWETYVWAAIVLGGDGAAACDGTAAALHGLTDDRQLPVHVIGGPAITRNKHEWVRFHRYGAEPRRILAGLAPPRVSVEDAALDVASQGTLTEAFAVLSAGVQSRRTTPERLLKTACGRSRLAHRQIIEAALADAAAGVHSALEAYHLRLVERPHGLPRARRQYPVPETEMYADGAYVEHRLLLEFDGLAYHDPVADQERDNLHTAYQYRTLRFGWVPIVEQFCRVALTIALSIGLPGVPRLCPRCPTA